ncbi:flagellar protein FliO/FliZ [Paenibacillus shirakamiensis]|uniref:Flagellar protein FliO/FliZ n=1 Tax=Paenibacillus shirakamiensis TaxID=1265935 RepID=A0ABS4JHC2_9BACL|nr:flagellar biosynthetic protein FliO [Paenibacillus shirakamiensis]MBP2001107.1 flagellar protein FliO/FliZ [Paenibacillus shirakamiensis]
MYLEVDTPFSTTGFISNVVNVIIVLIVIVVLIVFLIRFLGRRNRLFTRTQSIRTLGAVGLGPNKSLQVIEVGSSVYVIGVGENISLVDKIAEPEEVALLLTSFEEGTSDFASLSSTLSGWATRLRKPKATQDEELEGTPFQEVFESKLRKLPTRKQQMEDLLQDEQSKDR